MMDWLARMRQGMRSRYVRLLETQVARERGEIERLRAENRALLNSLLRTAGVPPVEAPPAHPAQIAPIRRRSGHRLPQLEKSKPRARRVRQANAEPVRADSDLHREEILCA